MYIYLVKHSVQAARRRGPGRVSGRAGLSVLPSCRHPGPGGEGDGEAARGEAAGITGRGGSPCRGRLAEPPRGAARWGLSSPCPWHRSGTACFWPQLCFLGVVVLTLAGAGPGEERAAPFHAALRDVAFATCGCRRDAVSPSPAATEHMAVFWLTGLVSSAVFVLFYFFFSCCFVFFSFLFSRAKCAASGCLRNNSKVSGETFKRLQKRSKKKEEIKRNATCRLFKLPVPPRAR